MRELERHSLTSFAPTTVCPERVAIVGRGRAGTALSAAFRAAGVSVIGPLGRESPARVIDADVVLLCVPDGEIAAAAAAVEPGPPVGHCSGATALDVLAPHPAFSLHPLMTFAGPGEPVALDGAGAAVAGSTPQTLALARSLAGRLGLAPIELADEDRAAYHAAASIASNFLVTLEAAAERLAASAGVERGLLIPLVRATVENWGRLGAQRALTGPVARGDEQTVERQRAAVAQRTPDLSELFDTLVKATQALVDAPGGERMKTIRTVSELRAELGPLRRAGRTIGLVPTMGALHEGHLSLMRRAREVCEVVVASLFVNPAQFNDATDLDVYPRDETRDAALAAELGIDVLFAPPVSEVYPPGFSTTVSVAGVSSGLEGEHRGAGHFDGVSTVVTKLLNMVSPDVAYFGQKDAQQLVVIRRLVRDLDLPVRIEACPTVRAADGLALSSRNALLSADERRRATALHHALSAVGRAAAAGAASPASALDAGRAVLEAAGVEVEYLSLVDPETMEPLTDLHGDALAVVAGRVGSTRLIDNVPITLTTAEPTAAGATPREEPR